MLKERLGNELGAEILDALEDYDIADEIEDLIKENKIKIKDEDEEPKVKIEFIENNDEDKKK